MLRNKFFVRWFEKLVIVIKGRGIERIRSELESIIFIKIIYFIGI